MVAEKASAHEGATFLEHAQAWVEGRGLLDADADYGGMLGRAVLRMAETFSDEGHSGMSAQLARAAFNWLCDAWDGLNTFMLTDESAAKARAVLQKRALAMIEGIDEVDKAAWTAAFVNRLPDSAFLYVQSGGSKDGEGKTVPRILRHFPYRDADGKVDLPHLRNAIARIPQSKIPGLSDDAKRALQERARRLLAGAGERSEKRHDVRRVCKVAGREEERFVLGVVLEPLEKDNPDAQGDFYSAEDVREAAHFFMENYAQIGLMHSGLVGKRVAILESYVAPEEFEVGGEKVQKGTWLLAARVRDDELWDLVKAGKLDGWSIGGVALRELVE